MATEPPLYYADKGDLNEILETLRKNKVRVFEAFGVKLQFADEAFYEAPEASPSSIPDIDDDERNEEVVYMSSE